MFHSYFTTVAVPGKSVPAIDLCPICWLVTGGAFFFATVSSKQTCRDSCDPQLFSSDAVCISSVNQSNNQAIIRDMRIPGFVSKTKSIFFISGIVWSRRANSSSRWRNFQTGWPQILISSLSPNNAVIPQAFLINLGPSLEKIVSTGTRSLLTFLEPAVLPTSSSPSIRAT